MIGLVARHRILGSLLWGISLVLLTALTGNSDAIDLRNIQDNAAVPAGDVAACPIGQTFVAHESGLHALEVRWIVPEHFLPAAGAQATMHVRQSPQAAEDLATASLPLAELTHNQFSKFVFAPIPDSNERSFYFFIDLAPTAIQGGTLSLWASDGDVYSDGRMHWNALPTDRDLVFRAYYEPDFPTLFSALVSMLAQYGPAILLFFGLLCFPGLLLTPFRQMFALPTAIGTGLGGLSALSLLLLFFRVENPLALYVLGILLTAGVLVRLVLAIRAGWRRELASSPVWAVPAAVAFGVGLLQIRDVPVPLWVDSYTHAQLIQTVVSKGQFPADNFYHLGYHAVTALWTRLTGLAIPQAMLLSGPLFVTLAGLGVFLLSRRLTGSPIAGLASAIGVWFLSPTPSYFTTWGRYPLLMGMAILPIALVLAVDWIDRPEFDWRSLALAALMAAGLAFSQVRLVAFYTVFVAIYLLRTLYHSAGRRRVTTFVRTAALLAIALGVGLMWLAFVFLRGVQPQALLAANSSAPFVDVSGSIAIVLTHHGPELVLLAVAGAVIGLVRRSQTVVLSVLWYAVLFSIALLPRTESVGALIPLDLVVLMGFMPMALVIGDAFGYVYGKLRGTAGSNHLLVWGATAACVVMIGARDMISVVNPSTVQFSKADSEAMEWIRERTPYSSKFLINSFRWYGSAIAPSDGGGWIPYVTGRAAVNLQPSPATPLEQIVTTNDIGFVYLGWRSGILAKSEFACQPERYTLVYDRDGISIFQIKGTGEPLEAIPLPSGCDGYG